VEFRSLAPDYRAAPFDSGALDDSETADAADQLLASLE
jgi:hypothetical protein